MTKTLKQKLAANEMTVGGWIMLGHPGVAEIMARAGLDWVVVDMEHSAVNTFQAEELMRAISYGGSAPLVRLTSNDPNQIKKVMDSGATGIIVPMVKSLEEAQAAVDAVYYPPRGKRGVGLSRAQKYGAPGAFVEYQKWLENEAVCIMQIEHIGAVEECEKIFAVDGVDGYILGPYDLSASMGLAGQTEHPDVLAAINRVCEVGKKMNIPGGIHVVEPDENKLKEAIAKGFNFNAYSIDTRIIDTICRNGIAAVKG